MRQTGQLLLCLLLLAPMASADDIPLDRNPQHYLAIGMRRAQIKNLRVVAPACHIGVACAGGGPLAA